MREDTTRRYSNTTTTARQPHLPIGFGRRLDGFKNLGMPNQSTPQSARNLARSNLAFCLAQTSATVRERESNIWTVCRGNGCPGITKASRASFNPTASASKSFLVMASSFDDGGLGPRLSLFGASLCRGASCIVSKRKGACQALFKLSLVRFLQIAIGVDSLF